ncbi:MULTISPECIES: hypothetical protein [unclassified Bradyrhizobium]
MDHARYRRNAARIPISYWHGVASFVARYIATLVMIVIVAPIAAVGSMMAARLIARRKLSRFDTEACEPRCLPKELVIQYAATDA